MADPIRVNHESVRGVETHTSLKLAPLSRRLAQTISLQLSELRRHFEDEGFLEIVVPHLTRNSSVPYRSTFQVSAPELNFSGALRVSANLFLAETSTELKRAYTVGPSFRASVAPASTPGSQLAEFQLVEAW